MCTKQREINGCIEWAIVRICVAVWKHFQHKHTNTLHAMQTIGKHIIYCFVFELFDDRWPDRIALNCQCPLRQSHSRYKFHRFTSLPFGVYCSFDFFCCCNITVGAVCATCRLLLFLAIVQCLSLRYVGHQYCCGKLWSDFDRCTSISCRFQKFQSITHWWKWIKSPGRRDNRHQLRFDRRNGQIKMKGQEKCSTNDYVNCCRSKWQKYCCHCDAKWKRAFVICLFFSSLK